MSSLRDLSDFFWVMEKKKKHGIFLVGISSPIWYMGNMLIHPMKHVG